MLKYIKGGSDRGKEEGRRVANDGPNPQPPRLTRKQAVQHSEDPALTTPLPESETELMPERMAQRQVTRERDEGESRAWRYMPSGESADSKAERYRKERNEWRHQARQREGERNERENAAQRYRQERNQGREAIISLQQDLERVKGENEQMQRTFQSLQRELHQQSELLSLRTREWRDANAYLSKEDSVSCADVVGMVGFLNSEIFQLACQVVEACDFVGDSVECPSNAAEHVQGHLGYTVVQLLGAVRTQTCDEVGMQMAVQALLAKFGALVVESWVGDSESEENALKQLYSKIYNAG